MNKLIVLSFFFIFYFTLNAQNTFSIKGSLKDSLDLPIPGVTVFLSSVKDSTLVQYSLSNSQGEFDFKVKQTQVPVVLRTSLFGYKEFNKSFKNGVFDNLDLGSIILQETVQDLDEVVIIAQAPPIRIVNDTLEFNASSFKVRPDANLQQLLKELPGVQIDEEQNITVNGKAVTEILVNGKPFFSEDGKVALENLPAEIISKVQVSDKKTKLERFTKQQARSDDASINITIAKENNKGYFGRISGGYGSADRYESALFLNSFNENRKVSVIGSANNINATGFSMNEVFDNMSTGKSKGGITQSRLLGINVVEHVNKKLNVNGSYNYNYADTKNQEKKSVTKFLPDSEFTSESSNESDNTTEGHSGNISIDYISNKSALYITPSFNLNHTWSQREGFELSKDQDQSIVNTSESKSQSTGANRNFGNTIRYIYNLNDKGQYFSLDFSNANGSNTSDMFYESSTDFFQSDKPKDDRKQIQHSKNINDSYNASVSFNQPINDSLSLVIGSRFEFNQDSSKLNVYDYDPITDSYSNLNVLQTNAYKSTQNKVAPYVSLNWNKSKFSFLADLNTSIVKNSAKGFYNAKDYTADRNYVNPDITTIFRYRFNKNESVNFRYSYAMTYQSASQLLAITDLSNPLHSIVGNPDLKPSGQHNFNLGFRSYDFQTRSGYSLSINSSFYQNSIVNSIEYDADRRSISTFKNISGNYQIGLSSEWFKSQKWQEHSLRYGVGLRYRNALQKGFIDGLQYSAYSHVLTPRIYLNYEYGDLLIIKPSYNYSYNATNYSNFQVDKASSFIHNVSLQTTTYWPKNIVFGNDISYNYNSQIASGFRKDFYMWNISLAYDFYQSKLRAKVKVYDLLNQNTSSRRTIDPMQIVDSETLVLKQYIMFSLVYNLNEFGSKQTKSALRSSQKAMRIR
ncbi:TonB-dependent receptor domain-containing protein [Myroides sp. LJL119]